MQSNSDTWHCKSKTGQHLKIVIENVPHHSIGRCIPKEHLTPIGLRYGLAGRINSQLVVTVTYKCADQHIELSLFLGPSP
jgi:hypothetical protein